MQATSQSRVFISYSQRGKGSAWKEALLRALHVFERHHLLDVWQDGRIRLSSFWNDDIQQAMASAQVAVVLLTREALESEYIRETEFPFLRDRQQRDKLPVFPVVCEECDWKIHDWLRATQAPNNSEPLSKLSKAAQEQVYRQLATEIAEQLGRGALASVFGESSRGEEGVGVTRESDARTYLDKFPLTHRGGQHEKELIGREQELALLDLAFAQPHTAIVSLVAWGGVGKTMLVQHWLQRLQRERWSRVRRVYGWNFYSQGTKEDRQASEDSFLAHALEWFGVRCEPTLSPWDKGRLLADAVARERTLLILDGVEPLQYPPGPMGGQLRAPGVQSLLKQLAHQASDTDRRGLCLVTTREPLNDLAGFQRRAGAAWGSVLRVDLSNLTEEAGAALLHHAGAGRAGAAEIKADDAELRAASREVDGHALTLNLLGRFLARAHGGDIRRRDLVKFEEADRKEQGGTTFKMLAAFENWFAKGGEFGARQLAVLWMLGLFDRPADAGCLGALRKPPVIAGLTDALFTTRFDASAGQSMEQPLVEEDWNTATSFLADFGLVTISEPDSGPIKGYDEQDAQMSRLFGLGAPRSFARPRGVSRGGAAVLDVHPLIREHFHNQLRRVKPEAYREGHRRLYELLKGSTPFWPEGIESLAPLYQAVVHGTCAGLHSEVLDNIYVKRIQRGSIYSTYHLGAFGACLAGLSSLFERLWDRPVPTLAEAAKAYLLATVGYCLPATGRLAEACEPLRAAMDYAARESAWDNAATAARNLGGAYLALGNVADAVNTGEAAVVFADAIADVTASAKSITRAFHAHALHQASRKGAASARFREAEGILRAHRPQYPLLISIGGSCYCDLLLAEAETTVWLRILDGSGSNPSGLFGPSVRVIDKRSPQPMAVQGCDDVERRAGQTLSWGEQKGLAPLDIGLDHLSIGRSILYRGILERSRSQFGSVRSHFQASAEGFRKSGDLNHLPQVFLSLSLLRFLEGDTRGGRADLDEAFDIAERGPMRLHMADIHLHRARLFFREKPYPWKSPQDDLAAAEKLINDCGYHRRDEELADAKRSIVGSS